MRQNSVRWNAQASVGVRGEMHPPHIRLEGGVNPPVAAIIFFAVTLFLPVSIRMAYQMQRRHLCHRCRSEIHLRKPEPSCATAESDGEMKYDVSALIGDARTPNE